MIPSLSESPFFSETLIGGQQEHNRNTQNSKVVAVSPAYMKAISTSRDSSRLHHNPPLLSTHNTAMSWALCSTTQSNSNGSTAARGVMAPCEEMLKAMNNTGFHRAFTGPGRPEAHSTLDCLLQAQLAKFR